MPRDEMAESTRRAQEGMGDRCGKCGRKVKLLHGKDHLCSRCFNVGKPKREMVKSR